MWTRFVLPWRIDCAGAGAGAPLPAPLTKAPVQPWTVRQGAGGGKRRLLGQAQARGAPCAAQAARGAAAASPDKPAEIAALAGILRASGAAVREMYGALPEEQRLPFLRDLAAFTRAPGDAGARVGEAPGEIGPADNDWESCLSFTPPSPDDQRNRWGGAGCNSIASARSGRGADQPVPDFPDEILPLRVRLKEVRDGFQRFSFPLRHFRSS